MLSALFFNLKASDPDCIKQKSI